MNTALRVAAPVPAYRRHALWLLVGLLALLAFDRPARAQSADEIAKIIQAFADKETRFKAAWLDYTYSQRLDLRVLSVNGRPTRESFRLDSEVVFDDRGRRKIEITRRIDRLASIGFTEEDVNVIHNLQPFVLTTEDLKDYDVRFDKKERVDEIDCYVFDVEPKETRKNRFYFSGKIWVDDQDLQIVMTRGRTIPEPKGQRFPEFETRRELIDNEFWFPTWTEAHDVLRFPGSKVEVHEVVTYENYRRFEVDAKIRYEPPKPPD